MYGRLQRVSALMPVEMALQPSPLPVNIIQSPDKKNKVDGIKGAINKILKSFQLDFIVAHNKIVGCRSHQIHHFMGTFDNRSPIPPGDGGCQKTRNFSVLFLKKQMRDLNRIKFNELWIIVKTGLLIKKVPQFFRT